MLENKRKVKLFGVDFWGSYPHCVIDKTIVPQLMNEAAQSVVNGAANIGCARWREQWPDNWRELGVKKSCENVSFYQGRRMQKNAQQIHASCHDSFHAIIQNFPRLIHA